MQNSASVGPAPTTEDRKGMCCEHIAWGVRNYVPSVSHVTGAVEQQWYLLSIISNAKDNCSTPLRAEATIKFQGKMCG